MKRVPLLQRLLQAVILLSLLTACSLPQVSAEERMFLDLSLDVLGEYSLSSNPTVAEQPMGHLSGITYSLPGYSHFNSPGTYFYGVSEDADPIEGVSVYQLKLDLETLTSDSRELPPFTLETVSLLKDQSAQVLNPQNLQVESLAFSPRESVFIAAEQSIDDQSVPLIGEFDLNTGQLKNTVPLPPTYRPQTDENKLTQGIQPNLGFRAMTIAPDGFSPGGLDPFRLFAIAAAPLFQDLDSDATQLRLLHYVIADRASFLVSENLYSLDSNPKTGSPSYLSAIVALPQSGHFLSLERSHTASGYHSKLYQVFTGNATDTSRISSLRKPISIVQPLQKKLLLDLDELNLPLQRLDSMTLGPKLPDGNQSLILIGNDPASPASATQFLLLSLKQKA